jgi:hypothetical protein
MGMASRWTALVLEARPIGIGRPPRSAPELRSSGSSLVAPAAIKGFSHQPLAGVFLVSGDSPRRIAGTVIAAIENLRPAVGDPHRPHRDGGSPDTDQPQRRRQRCRARPDV